MQIGELGRRAGVAAKTIRYYEQIGLLEEPARSANGYRNYGDDAVGRLRFIRDAQSTGLSLSEIASVLEMRDGGEQTCGHVIELLERHLDDIDHRVDQLRRTRKLLAELTERAKALDPSNCVDPNRCQTISENSAVPPVLRNTTRRTHGSPAPHAHN